MGVRVAITHEFMHPLFRWSKSKLGANAILAVSMAICRAGAAAKKEPLYKVCTMDLMMSFIHACLFFQYIAGLAGNPTDKFVMPVPAMNVINGGSHAGNKLAMQVRRGRQPTHHPSLISSTIRSS